MFRPTTLSVLAAASTALATLTPGLALADGAPPRMDFSFSSVNRVGGSSHLSMQTAYAYTFDDRLDDVSFGRTDIEAQYIHTSGFGGYVTVPVHSVFVNDGGNNHELGALGTGAVWQMPISDSWMTVVRVGLLLPTASDDIVVLPAPLRLTDLAEQMPERTLARLSSSQLLRTGALFARLDLGVDLALTDAPSDVAPDDAGVFVRVNAAVGVDVTEHVALAAELASVGILDTEEDALADQFSHAAALTATLRSGATQPFIAVSTPLDGATRGDLMEVTVGLRSAF